MLATPGERGVIGRGQLETQHPEDRRQEAFSLPQGQVEDEPERQRGFDGEIGILPLPATFADPHGLPSGDRIRGQPHGDIASLDQRSVVCRPMSDVVFCLVLRVHSRLHIEIMHLLSPRWPGGRSWLTEGAGSVHQRHVTLWLSADATDAWRPSPSGRPGAPKTFSDCAIETALTLRLVFRVPLRQAEGFLRSVWSLMGVDLAAPDHTTLSRRSQSLAVECRRIPSRGPIHLIVDSTGLSIVGEGEWAAVNHGGRGHRGWKTLHLAVDRVGVIVAHALTEPTVDAAITGISLVDEVDGHLTRVTADPAYDTLAFYGAAGARGARVVVPPTKTASLSRRGARSGARDRTIRRVKALGRRRWKKASGSHQHARVENAFFRYKSIVGDCLRARSSSGQRREAVLACNVLNRMTELGRPVSYRIGR